MKMETPYNYINENNLCKEEKDKIREEKLKLFSLFESKSYKIMLETNLTKLLNDN